MDNRKMFEKWLLGIIFDLSRDKSWKSEYYWDQIFRLKWDGPLRREQKNIDCIERKTMKLSRNAAKNKEKRPNSEKFVVILFWRKTPF